MAGFKLCTNCKDEYENPLDRRFHAQPIACPQCGPQLEFIHDNQVICNGEDALQKSRQWLREGKILAIKGLGGYHLTCDATNSKTVSLLRERKKRSDRPFALMAFNLETVNRFCKISPAEAIEIQTPQHPILLLEKKADCSLPEEVAPHQNHLGFMLPYTPLHLLLLEPQVDFPLALVMTSGNLSDEPIAYEDEDALARLSGIADGFLIHNRPIHMRVDDSVSRIVENQRYPIRRSRGYAPDPIQVGITLPEILACGAELINTFCLTRDHYAFLSHHIGDLENYETLQSFEEGIAHYERLFRIRPASIVADLHPDYLSTKYAVERVRKEGIPLIQVQHHHAHLAACLADNHRPFDETTIGLIFDGTGYGTDGKIWGGEILIGSYAQYQRRFHLPETPLPGADYAIRNPSRIALAHLSAAHLPWTEDLPPLQHLSIQEREVLHAQIEKGINCPLTTSMGRLFDAVAALIGIRQTATYEGQAAIELENACAPSETRAYTISFSSDIIQTDVMFSQILEDLRSFVPANLISARFHNGLALMCLQACELIKQEVSLTTVALSGGVWQNITLLRKTAALLHSRGFEVLLHHQVPTNDGGIALGQSMAASAILAQ